MELLKVVVNAALAVNGNKKHWTMAKLSYAFIGNHETLKQGEASSRWKDTPVDPASTLTHVAMR